MSAGVPEKNERENSSWDHRGTVPTCGNVPHLSASKQEKERGRGERRRRA